MSPMTSDDAPRLLPRLWRIALALKADLRWWRIETLDADQQTHQRAKPQPYLFTTLDLLASLGGSTIVEIGMLRQAMTPRCIARFPPPATPRATPSPEIEADSFSAPACCNDGHSTYYWARSGLAVHSVDVDERCRAEVVRSYANLGEPMPSNLELHAPQDGIRFLAAFDGTIDLLYLDGWDKGTPGYAERHLEAFEAARPRLAPLHLVSIDDTDFDTAEGGKDSLLTPRLLDAGYVPLVRGRQTVFLGSNPSAADGP
jgi:hypothetical protein